MNVVLRPDYFAIYILLHFSRFLLNMSLTLRRYLCGTKWMSLRSSRILNPSISRPIRASHEPGVSGVSNARTPIRTSNKPKTILKTLRIFYGKKILQWITG